MKPITLIFLFIFASCALPVRGQCCDPSRYVVWSTNPNNPDYEASRGDAR